MKGAARSRSIASRQIIKRQQGEGVTTDAQNYYGTQKRRPLHFAAMTTSKREGIRHQHATLKGCRHNAAHLLQNML